MSRPSTPKSKSPSPVSGAADDDDIQEDFCLQLDHYPLLTKFATTEEYKQETFVKEFARLIPGGMYFNFRIQLDERRNIKITPLLDNVPSQVKENYKRNPDFFSSYMSLQLKNSNILPSLIDLLDLGKQVSIALRVIEKSTRDFTFSFFSFHKDQSIFTLLQYYHFTQPFVLGTEILLGYKEDESLLPHELSPFSPEKTGKLSKMQTTISEINAELKEEGTEAVILRGKYNNGDTMVFSDPLLRHATITPKEIKEGNSMKITIPKKGSLSSTNTRETSVRICSERETTTTEMVAGRQAVAMFIFLDTQDYSYPGDKYGTPFVIDLVGTPPIKTIHFDKNKFKDFIKSLSSGSGCVTISGIKIINRGGKRRRIRRCKTKKIRKNKTKNIRQNIRKIRRSKSKRINLSD
jgi:hypothetical protein